MIDNLQTPKHKTNQIQKSLSPFLNVLIFYRPFSIQLTQFYKHAAKISKHCNSDKYNF